MADKIYLRNEIAGETKVSYLDKQDQKIYYRGISLERLIHQKASFGDVAYWLLFGKLPEIAALPPLSHEQFFNPISRTLRAQPRAAHPMDVLSIIVRALGNVSFFKAVDEQEQRMLDEGFAKDLYRNVGYMVGVMKRWYGRNRPLRKSNPYTSISKNILYQMFGREPDEFEAWLMDIALILYAEHGFNASTFVVRVAASAHTDIFSAVVSGISTLRGSRHGGANEDAMNLMLDIGDPDKTKAYLDRFFETPGAKVPGFGHPVYTISDPRVAILRPYVKELSERKNDMRWYEMGLALEEYMAELAKQKGKGIPANVDLWTAPLYYLMGIPIPMYTPLFAASRVAGWCAHYLEVLYVTKDAILRPREKYIGPKLQP